MKKVFENRIKSATMRYETWKYLNQIIKQAIESNWTQFSPVHHQTDFGLVLN